MTGDVHTHGVRDPHDLLGVPRGADRQQVIRAFHRRVKDGGHPDTGGDTRTFEEIIQARDALLNQAAYESRRRAPQPTAPPRVRPDPKIRPRSAAPPPREMSRLAITTVVLALLGPLLWPVAIVIGHLALHRIKRTGQGGATVVPVVLFFLYVLTPAVLLRILSVMFIP